jgi:hypothetical protein
MVSAASANAIAPLPSDGIASDGEAAAGPEHAIGAAESLHGL